MKTISKFLLIAASLCAVALVSCRKDNNEQKKVEEATFEAPAMAEAAVKVQFNTEATGAAAAPIVNENNDKGELVQKKIKDIEFTESGYAIITKVIVKGNSGVQSHATKADDEEEEVTITTYTFKDGEYDVKGFAIVKVNEKTKTVEIVVKDASGNTVETVTATATTVSEGTGAEEGSAEFNLCRAWVVNRIVVGVKGGALGPNGVGAVLDAPVKMADVEKQLKDNKVNLPANVVLSDYDIVDINFTQAGTFFINFTKAAPFTGVYSLTANKTFHYDLKGEGNYIFNATADGNVDFQKVDGVDYCYFNIKGEFEGGNVKYTTSIEITLKEKKN